MRESDRFRTRTLGPGVRLHLLSTRRFATTWCRVVLPRRLGPDATRTSLLASILQSATARHPTREALAWRLADLHGASLAVGVAKVGHAHLLGAALEWPTAHVSTSSRALDEGLELLADVLYRPKREAGQDALDVAIFETERTNLRRTLRALRDDKPRYAHRRCVELACPGEAYGLDALGREDDLDGLTPAALARHHAQVVGGTPREVFLIGDIDPEAAVRAVRRHLARSLPRARRLPAAVSVRASRARPRRVVEHEGITQTRVALAWRAAVRPSSPLYPAALLLAGSLGGGSYGRLFKIVRESHALAYDVAAAWVGAKGLLLVEAGIEPASERRTVSLVRSLVRELAAGHVDPLARKGYLESLESRIAALPDDRAAWVAWRAECLLLGVPPTPRRLLTEARAVGAAALRRLGRRLGEEALFVLGPGRGPR